MGIIDKIKAALASFGAKAKELKESDAAQNAKERLARKSKETGSWIKKTGDKSAEDFKSGLITLKDKAKEFNESETTRQAKDKISENSKAAFYWLKSNRITQSFVAFLRRYPLKVSVAILAMVGLVLFLNWDTEIDMAETHEFDELASDPDDPDRVSKGVALVDIIPFKAKKIGDEALKDHPKHPRLVYQMGRVYEASGEFETAFEYYEKASKLDYTIAKIRLADFYASGKYVEVDLEKVKLLLAEAEKAGSKLAAKKLERYFFNPDGFAYPEDFKAIYEGEFANFKSSKGDLTLHIYNFVVTMQEIEECPQLLSNEGAVALSQKGMSIGLGKAFGMIANSRRSSPASRGPGIDYAGSFAQGIKEGNAMALEAANQGSAAQNDVVLFWRKYGAQSPVAKRMFLQMDRFIRGLEGVGFMSELEKNMYGR